MSESLLVSEMDVVFKTMAAAFANLEIPPAYALVFYLAIFLAGLMFLVCIWYKVFVFATYSKICVKRPLKNRQKERP